MKFFTTAKGALVFVCTDMSYATVNENNLDFIAMRRLFTR